MLNSSRVSKCYQRTSGPLSERGYSSCRVEHSANHLRERPAFILSSKFPGFWFSLHCTSLSLHWTRVLSLGFCLKNFKIALQVSCSDGPTRQSQAGSATMDLDLNAHELGRERREGTRFYLSNSIPGFLICMSWGDIRASWGTLGLWMPKRTVKIIIFKKLENCNKNY